MLPILFFISANLPAQDLYIEYNAKKNETKYYNMVQNTKKYLDSSGLSVRKGSSIILVAENINNFAYRVAFQTNQQERDYSSVNFLNFGFPATNGLSGFGMNSVWKSSNLMKPDTLRERINDDNQGFGVNNDNSQKALQENQFSNEDIILMGNLESTELFFKENVEKSYNVIDRYNKFLLAQSDLNNVREGIYTDKNAIIEIVSEYLRACFGIDEGVSTPNIERIISLSNTRKELTVKHDEMLKLIGRYKNSLDSLQKSLERSKSKGSTSNVAQLKDWISSGNSNLKTMQEMVDVLNSQLYDLKDLSLQDVHHLCTALVAVRDDSFSSRKSIQAEKDFVKVSMTILPSESNIKVKEEQNVIDQIEINVYGGIKINTSTGMSIGSFFKRPEEFSVRNQQIVSTPTDAFLLVASSNIHVYSPGKGDVSFGGTLGIGLPVSMGNGISQSPVFSIGPSVILGKKQRATATLGIMGARTNKLGSGLKVGDTFAGLDGVLDVVHPYDWAWFLGVTYDLYRQ